MSAGCTHVVVQSNNAAMFSTDMQVEMPAGDDAVEKEPAPPVVSFSQLYQFTSALEKLFLFIGMLCALGCGAALPTLLIAFGDAFDQLGVAETLPEESVMGTEMTKMLLTFVWIGVGIGTGKFVYISCVDYVCSSQMLKYKTSFF